MTQSVTMTLLPQFITCGGAAVFERNTFIDLRPPEPLTLEKAQTDPPPGLSRLAVEEPPPPLPLEFFVTPDVFEEYCEVRSSGARSTSPLSIAVPPEENRSSHPSLTMPSIAEPPPNLIPLEKMATYDPFESYSYQPREEPMSAIRGEEMQGHYERFFLPAGIMELGTHSSDVADRPKQRLVLEAAIPIEFPETAPLYQQGLSSDIAVPQGFSHRVPPPPPAAPAPVLTERPAPAPPTAPPVEGAEAPPSAADLLANALKCEVSENGSTHVHWSVDARKLYSTDVRVVSPQFLLELPGCGQQAFKVALHPRVVINNKRGGGFKKAKGKGSVMLKCEAQLLEAECVGHVQFSVRVGRGSLMQQPRGPVTNDFAEKSCCGLPEGSDEWDFRSIADEFGFLLVSVHIWPRSAGLAASQ